MNDDTGLYIVKQGDTLEKIAARSNITPGQVKSLNRLSDRTVYAGQPLKLPLPVELPAAQSHSDSPALAAAAPAPAPPQSAQETQRAGVASFLKIKSKCFTRCDGTVSGLLLVTPNSIMFDPDLMHPLIVEKGPAKYTITAPLGALVSLAMYRHLPLNAVHDVTLQPDAEGQLSQLGLQCEAPVDPDRTAPESSVSCESDGNDSLEIPEISVADASFEDVVSRGSDVFLQQESPPLDIRSTPKKVQFSLFDEKANAVGEQRVGRKKQDSTRDWPSDLSMCPSLDGLAAKHGRDGCVSPELAPVLRRNRKAMPTSCSGSEIAASALHLERMNSQQSLPFNIDSRLSKLDSTRGNVERDETIERFFENPKQIRDQVRLSDGDEERQKSLAESMGSADSQASRGTVRPVLPYYLCVRVDNDVACALRWHRQLKKHDSSPLANTSSSSVDLLASHQSENGGASGCSPTKDTHRFVNYWFTVPKSKVDSLYSFLLTWLPEKFNKRQRHASGTCVKSGALVAMGTSSTGADTEDLFGFVLLQHEDVVPTPVLPEWGAAHTMLNLNQQWEIVTVEEVKRRMSVLDLFREPALHTLPDGSDRPLSLRGDRMVDQLIRVLPPRAQGYPWRRVYSSDTDGFSLNTLYRQMANVSDWSPSVLIVTDTSRQVFGAVLSCPIRLQETFSACYGTGESFLFKFRETESGAGDEGPALVRFGWSGKNLCIANAQPDSLTLGAGGAGLGLHLDSDLNRGSSCRCDTFCNEPLHCERDGDFFIWRVEAFVFGLDR